MSTIRALVPYHFETKGREAGQNLSRDTKGRHSPRGSRPENAQRQPEFLVQMMVDGDQDLRKPLGRRDIAEQRATAYGEALASRPSARPLSFLRLVETA
jgi:hypothetical protein